MRIIVMGTGPFAVPSLNQVLAQGHDIPVVVTRPSTESSSKKIPERPVAQWAVSQGLPLFEPDSINSAQAISRLRDWKPDLLFVCDYGQILSADCISTSRLGGINLHGSLLPRHRGAAPVQWSLLSGDLRAGVSVIHITPRLDAGPILSVRSTEIRPDETAEQLEPRLADMGGLATLEAIEMLQKWDGQSTIGQLQDRSLVTRAPRFSKADGQLDFRLPADYLARLVRACQPWPSTYAELQWPAGKRLRLIVRSARACQQEKQSVEAVARMPGQVRQVDSQEAQLLWPGAGQQLLAATTGSGTLLISRLQPAGKREMEVAEFLRGHPLDAASQFILPEIMLKPLTA
ncbi:MAG TPA: methionyl-tRNA formyltransferase [Planctomycetaceae bacterium]|nr:methionyl-tRNA formyltransferase [Planctomycetaceae bacterium]